MRSWWFFDTNRMTEVMERRRWTGETLDASIQSSIVAPWDHRKCVLLCRTEKVLSRRSGLVCTPSFLSMKITRKGGEKWKLPPSNALCSVHSYWWIRTDTTAALFLPPPTKCREELKIKNNHEKKKSKKLQARSNLLVHFITTIYYHKTTENRLWEELTFFFMPPSPPPPFWEDLERLYKE